MLNHRAFGECPKAVLSAGSVFNLQSTPQTIDSLPILGGQRFSFAHLVCLEAGNVNFFQTFDLKGEAFRTCAATPNVQISGVKQVTLIDSGKFQAFFF
jgi:hypothetical protein